MRIALIGASPMAVITARMLVGAHHDVIIVERDAAKIEALNPTIDCGFIHGDGTKPAILREVGAEGTDFLFCLTDNDQSNILAAVVGRSLGFKRVVPKIEDPEYEHICLEIGLTDTIIPDRMVAQLLADLASGEATPELFAFIKGDLRGLSFVADDAEAGPVEKLDLPDQTKAICLYRGGKFILTDPDTEIQEGDEVVLLTHQKYLDKLRERWGKAPAG